MQSFSAQELSRFGAPTLISRNTNDITQVQTVVNMGLMFMVSIPIMMVGGILMAMHVDLGLSWLVAVSVPILVVVIGFVITLFLWIRDARRDGYLSLPLTGHTRTFLTGRGAAPPAASPASASSRRDASNVRHAAASAFGRSPSRTLF